MFKRFQKIRNFKAVAILVATAFVLLIFAPIFYFVFIPVYIGNTPIQVVVEEGQGAGTIAGILKEKGLIKSELVFRAYTKLSGEGDNLKAGKYNFSGRLDVPEIVFILANGLSESEDIRLLVSEGFNIWEIDERLVSLKLIKEGEFSSKYHDDEGYLFPDTYRINREAEGIDFVNTLRERMRDNFNKKTAELLGGLSLSESREIIVIASILEKEARSEEDMKLVSGIIRRRIKLGMPLQVDASVIYGACRRKAAEGGWTKNCEVTFQGPAIEIPIDGP